MIQQLNRHSYFVPAVAALVLSVALTRGAEADLLSGFDGNFSSSTGVDWTSDGLSTQAFVSGYGVTQGTQALAITQNASPPQRVDMKLITLNSVPLVAANNFLLMDVTVPENVGGRQVWLSFRGDSGLFENSPELAFDSALPARSGTVVWNYASTGLKDLAASYAGSFWTIAIGIRGNDFNGPITTIVDNVRFSTVPEPTTILSCLIGLACFAAGRRRRA